MHRPRILLTAFVAIVAFAFATGSASANRSLELRGAEGGVRASSHLTLNGSGLGASTAVICDITLLRTLSRIIPKRAGVLMGRVTGIAVEGCRGGELVGARPVVTILQEEGRAAPKTGNLFDLTRAPANLWKLIYDSFRGTLPRITGVSFHIQGAQFRIQTELGIRCLFTGNALGIINTNERGVVTGAEANLAGTALTKVEEFFCPIATGTFNGNFAVTPTLTIALL